MPNLKQSKKRALQDIKKTSSNKKKLSTVRTYIKNFLKLIKLKNLDLASKNFSFLISKIDKSVNKNIFKKRKANRLKHKLNLKLKILKEFKGM